MAMMAITTKSSIRVKALRFAFVIDIQSSWGLLKSASHSLRNGTIASSGEMLEMAGGPARNQ
jgi:hypothetical protein